MASDETRARTAARLLATGVAASALLWSAGASAQETAPQTTDERIRALEAQIEALSTQVQDLKASTSAQIKDVRDTQAATTISLDNGRPTFKTADGKFSAAIRSVFQFDAAQYDQDDGAATDLSSGTNFRRARLGVDGAAYKNWNYAIWAEFGGSGGESSQLNQAYVEYVGFKPFDFASPLRLRVGAWATPANLEDATSNTEALFIERASVAELERAIAGGDGRTGVGAFLNGDRWYTSAVLTGATLGTPSTPEFDEQTGYLARVAFLPLRSPDFGVHIGANVTGIIDPADTAAGPATTQAVRLRDRPELRVDGAQFVDTGAIPADGATAYGVELGAAWRNFYLAGEYVKYQIDRTTAGLDDPEFGGWYVQGAWTITGEGRSWSGANGGFRGIKPAKIFDPKKGEWGAWEIAARHSVLNLNDNEGSAGFPTPTGGVRGGEQTISTLGLNWYPNNVVRFLLDYQWVDIERLNVAGASLDQDYNAIALRSQVAF